MSAGTAAVDRVPVSATSVRLLAADPARLGFRILNDSVIDLYVRYDGPASGTDHSEVIPPGGFLVDDDHRGELHGAWASAGSGGAQVTDLR